MDSANSDSMQSSSGDEEYDSRADTISPYLNPSLNFGSIISNHPPPPPPQHLSSHRSHPPTLFDPQSQNLGAFSHTPPNPNLNADSLYNLDSVWPTRGLIRSDIDQPIYADLGNLTGGLSSSSLSSSLSSSTQSLLGIQGTHQSQFPSSSSVALPSVDENGGRASSHQTNNQVAKNTRKRTRASRRAPTTVLTTDTSNFRQMVQEFTGIPAPPFSATSPYSRRLDLFATGSTLRSGHVDSLGPLYPFRPSALKVQQQQPSLPFVSSSSSSPSLLNSTMNIDSIAPITNIPNATNNTITTTSIAGPSNNFSSTSSSYQMNPPMLNMQNPVFTFQSILQSSLRYPLPNAPIFSSKSHQPSSEIPSLDELGMTHEHVNPNNLSGFPSHGNSDGTQVGNNNNLSMWRSHEEPSNDGGQQQQQQQQQQQHLGSFDGNNGDSQHYNLNCSGSTSDFHPDKCLENVSSRNEGTVDSWICPSDSDLCSNKQYA